MIAQLHGLTADIWTAAESTIGDVLPSVAAAALVLFLFWLLFRAVRTPLRMVMARAKIHDALITLLVDKVVRLVLILVALVMALDQLGVNVTAAVAGLGVAGVAVGFAAQDTLANIIAGILIFWDRPFLAGHWVTVASQYGEVREITLRSTRIRTNDNTFIVIPNKRIIDEVLINHSTKGDTRVRIPIGIAYKEDIASARKAVLSAVADLKHILPSPAPEVVVSGLGASSVDMIVRVWISDATYERPVFYAVMEASKNALDKAGIEIPYHHLQLFIENVDQRVWRELANLTPTPLAAAAAKLEAEP